MEEAAILMRITFPNASVLVAMWKCKCSSGYMGEYCGTGLSQGVPPGTNGVRAIDNHSDHHNCCFSHFRTFPLSENRSLLSSLSKLSSLSSFKSSENGNGVTFRSADDVNMNTGVTSFRPESTLDRSLAITEHFATDFRKPPIIFENPTYASKDTTITVAQPTTAPVTESGMVYNKNYGSPINPAEQGSETKPGPSSPDETQPTKWNIFEQKPKQNVNFENPFYSEMENEPKVNAAKVSWKKGSTRGYSATTGYRRY